VLTEPDGIFNWLCSYTYLIIKTSRCTNFSNLFLDWNSTCFLYHQEFFTVHTAMVNVIQVCWQLASRIKMEMQFRPDPACKLSAHLYDICHCCVYSGKTPDDWQRNCPKHVEFQSKNKFEKLLHLFGFIIGNYHDARCHERQILIYFLNSINFVLENVWS